MSKKYKKNTSDFRASKKYKELAEAKKTFLFPKKIQSTLLPSVATIAKKRGFGSIPIFRDWSKIVGDKEIAQESIPIKLSGRAEKSDQVLHVKTSSRQCALRLQYEEPQILAKIRMFYGITTIVRVKVVMVMKS